MDERDVLGPLDRVGRQEGRPDRVGRVGLCAVEGGDVGGVLDPEGSAADDEDVACAGDGRLLGFEEGDPFGFGCGGVGEWWREGAAERLWDRVERSAWHDERRANYALT